MMYLPHRSGQISEEDLFAFTSGTKINNETDLHSAHHYNGMRNNLFSNGAFGTILTEDVAAQMHAQMSLLDTIPQSGKSEGAGAKTFPEKLMSLLSKSVVDNEIAESICWLDHGKSFVVCNPEKFSKEILPTYFKQAKYSSFTRKLYRWGFRHITKGPDANSFYHELFQRDNGKLCLNMYCTYSDGVKRNKRARVNRKTEESSRTVPVGAEVHTDSMGDYEKMNEMMQTSTSLQMQLQMQKLEMQKLEMQKMQLQLQRMQMQIQMNAQMMGTSTSNEDQASSDYEYSGPFDIFAGIDSDDEDATLHNGGVVMPQHVDLEGMMAMQGMKSDSFHGMNMSRSANHIRKQPSVYPMPAFNENDDKLSHMSFQPKFMAGDSGFMSQQAYIAKLRQHMSNDTLKMGMGSSPVA